MDQDGIRQVSAGRGSDWIGEGWAMFRQTPGTWIGLIVCWMLLLAVIGSAPLVGSIASNLLSPVFTAGIFLGCLRAEQGGVLLIEDLFLAFKRDRLSALLILGAIGMAAFLVVFLIGGLFGLGAFLTLGADFEAGIEQMGAGVLFGVLIVLLLLLPVIMALWFAAPLVGIAGVEPVASLKLSFTASLRNMWPLTVWSLLALLIMIVATVPLFLGWLVAGPLLTASYYRMYRDIFAELPVPASSETELPLGQP